MTFDVKKIQSLTEQSLGDLKTIEKLGDLEHLAELSNEIKKALDSGEMEAISPMLPPYMADWLFVGKLQVNSDTCFKSFKRIVGTNGSIVTY